MDSNFQLIYPKGGTNKMWEPLHIEMNIGQPLGLTIHGRTDGRDGCQLILLDEKGQEMANYRYDYHRFGPGYFPRMAKDMAENMNIIFELEETDFRVTADILADAMKHTLNKCESRYGSHLPDVDYEVCVIFK